MVQLTYSCVHSTRRSRHFGRNGFLALYDYDPATDSLHPPLSNDRFITVMAIDNLPCELPRSASEEFGRDLIDRILNPLLNDDSEGVTARGTIAQNGNLTSYFEYLRDYVSQ